MSSVPLPVKSPTPTTLLFRSNTTGDTGFYETSTASIPAGTTSAHRGRCAFTAKQ
jgi:hypothetical protein